MIRKTDVLRLAGATLVAMALVPWLSASPASAGNNSSGSPGDHKVTICHRTNSDSNSYVVITVDTDAAGGGKDKGVGDHAAEHQGPVWSPTLKAGHIEWGDIIPPYLDDQGVAFPGYNWSAAGQAIYANGCQPVTPPTTSSAPVTTTSSVPVTTSTSAAVSSSVPVTTSTSARVTTSSVPVTTSTSAAVSSSVPVTTSTSAAVTTAARGASVLPTEVSTSPAGGGGETENAAVLGAKAGAPLPATGGRLPLGAALALSVGLLLAGGALIVLPGRVAVERNRRH